MFSKITGTHSNTGASIVAWGINDDADANSDPNSEAVMMTLILTLILTLRMMMTALVREAQC